MLKGITFADLVAGVLAVIGLVTICILAISSKSIPNEVVAFVTLITGYLFRGAQTPVANGIKAVTGNGPLIP